MYCSGCGFALAQGQAVCPQCGRPVMGVAPPPVPPVPAFQFELAGYASKMRALATVWYIYGGLALLTGIIGMTFMNAWFHGHGMWIHGPWGRSPFLFGPIIRFGWAFVVGRSVLALLAGYGLMERASWGRMVAIVAAFLSILKFPFGTAIGIWTLIMLMGYRNTTLYEQISQP